MLRPGLRLLSRYVTPSSAYCKYVTCHQLPELVENFRVASIDGGLLLMIQEPELDMIGVFGESRVKIVDALKLLHNQCNPIHSPNATECKRSSTTSRIKRRKSVKKEDPPTLINSWSPTKPELITNRKTAKRKAYLKLMDDVWRSSAFQGCAPPISPTIADDISRDGLVQVVTEAVHQVADWLKRVERSMMVERSLPMEPPSSDGEHGTGLRLVFDTMVDMANSGTTQAGNLTR